MGEDVFGALGEPNAVHDGGVVEFVGKKGDREGAEGGEDAEVGLEAGWEEQGGLGALELGEEFFEVLVDLFGSADEAGCACAGAPGGRGLLGCLDDFGVVGEAEEVIAGEIDEGRVGIGESVWRGRGKGGVEKAQ